MKKCTKCQQDKYLIDFPIDNRYKDGRHSWCKSCHNEYTKLYQITNQGMLNKAKAFQKYYKTEKGKCTIRKNDAKRKRNLGFIQMFKNPFEESVGIEWHHITNGYVVAIPKELHKLYYGNNHREKIMEIVKQIYLC